MTDDDPDPGTDPLAGRDPHPRTQIDLWPLHDARQELLEEIVSQPGAGNTAPSARRVLIPAGIAAAIALVIGVAWVAVSNDDPNSDNDDQVAAATSDDPAPTEATDPTSPNTEVTTEATGEPTKEPRRQDEARNRGVRIGNVRTLRECLVDIGRVDNGKGKRVRVGKLSKRGRNNWVLYVVRDGRRAVALGDDCKWMRVVPERPRR